MALSCLQIVSSLRLTCTRYHLSLTASFAQLQVILCLALISVDMPDSICRLLQALTACIGLLQRMDWMSLTSSAICQLSPTSIFFQLDNLIFFSNQCSLVRQDLLAVASAHSRLLICR